MDAIVADLALLKNWAPVVLQQGDGASLKDLKEIIKIRCRLAESVTHFLQDDKAGPFFAMLRADRLCEPHCRTLLRLPIEEAREAASEVGGHLNPSSWYGVHVWFSIIAEPGAFSRASLLNRAGEEDF